MFTILMWILWALLTLALCSCSYFFGVKKGIHKAENILQPYIKEFNKLKNNMGNKEHG